VRITFQLVPNPTTFKRLFGVPFLEDYITHAQPLFTEEIVEEPERFRDHETI